MKKVSRICYHLIFWIGLPLLPIFFQWANQVNSSLPGLPKPATSTFLEILQGNLETITIILIVAIPIFYLSFCFLTPRLLYKRNPVNYFLFAAALIMYSIVIKFLDFKIFPMSFWFGTPYYYKILIPIVLLSGFAGTLYSFYEKYQQELLHKLALEKQNYELELSNLKSTIGPHFLFNTINNIDILILKNPEKASEYLKKLADILRFMLYKTNNDLIPLKLELEYIQKYIELQNLRTSNNDYVKIEIKGDDKDWNVPPLLYIPFIENAFKYSSNKKIKDAIKINFNISDNEISFLCVNIITPQTNTGEEQGLGIGLIKRRLNLLYKENYLFEHEEKDGSYLVKLIINR